MFILFIFNLHQLTLSSFTLLTTALCGLLALLVINTRLGNLQQSPGLKLMTLLLKVILIYTTFNIGFGGAFKLAKINISTPAKIEFLATTHVGIVLDQVSTPFFLTTLLIGLVTVFFTHYYMGGEVHANRFIRLLILFLLSMLLFLTSDNLITIFLGWELIGLYSYLLINFWVVKTTALKSAFKALVYNQLSDAALLGFIVSTYAHTKQLNITQLEAVPELATHSITALCLLICASCKSAQTPFHYWLPDSMEAPIPASALIHSATLVSAGIFLVVRFSSIHQLNTALLTTATYMSLITILVGGVGAATQSDLKKTLAYSTISNCGFMMLFALTNNHSLCFFYFLAHGIFKALSFLFVGSVVLLNAHKQDWRYNQLTNSNKQSLLTGLTITLLFLGAWPLTINNVVKHLNILTLSNLNIYYITPAIINTVTLFGSMLSLVYSSNIIFNLYTSTNVKTTNSDSDAHPALTKQLPSYMLITATTTILLVLTLLVLTNAQVLGDVSTNAFYTYRAASTTSLWDTSLIVLSVFLLTYKRGAWCFNPATLIAGWLLLGWWIV